MQAGSQAARQAGSQAGTCRSVQLADAGSHQRGGLRPAQQGHAVPSRQEHARHDAGEGLGVVARVVAHDHPACRRHPVRAGQAGAISEGGTPPGQGKRAQ
jgi:hypothetical protein